MNDNTNGIVEIDLPLDEVEQTLVSCPLLRGDLRPVKDCLSGCEHFATVKDKIPQDNKERHFQQRYVLGCRYPTARPLFRVRLKDDSTK